MSAMQRRFDGAEADAEQLGDLGLGAILVVTEGDDGALARRQAAERIDQLVHGRVALDSSRLRRAFEEPWPECA